MTLDERYYSTKSIKTAQENGARNAAFAVLTAEPLTPFQAAAHELSACGLHPFPLPYGSKEPVAPNGQKLPWKRYGLTLYQMRPDQLNEVFAGRCNIAVIVGTHTPGAGHFFVIDCDTPQALDWHMDQMDARGLPIWATLTGRGGQIWLFCADGQVENLPARNAPGYITDCDIKGNNGYVVAPPSLHPSGRFYGWIRRDTAMPPTVQLTDVNWLVDSTGQPITLKAKRQRKARRQDVGQYLLSGASKGSRNTRLFIAAADVLHNGGDVEEVKERARQDGLTEREIEATVASAAKANYRAPKGKSSDDSRAMWRRANAFMQQYDHWKGRAGSTDRAVFAALIIRCQLDSNGTGQFRASVRELADLARLSTNTILASLKRIQAEAVKHTHPLPLVKRVDYTPIGANVWRFAEVVLKGTKEARVRTIETVGNYVTTVDVLSQLRVFGDTLERGAIGRSGMLIYAALLKSETPQTARQIAAAVNLSVRAVEGLLSSLKPLRTEGMVQRARGGYIAMPLTAAELQRIAAHRGKAGAGERRRAKHLEEREKRIGERLKRWRERNDPDYPNYMPPRRKASKAEKREISAPQGVEAVQPVETPQIAEKDEFIRFPRGINPFLAERSNQHANDS